MKFITPVFRVSFPNVFNPSDYDGKIRYQLTMLFEPDDVEDLRKAIEEVARAEFPKLFKSDVWPKSIRHPLIDGDTKPDLGYEGLIFCRTKSTRKPGVVDANRDPILDPSDFYSGCYARASVNIYAYNNQSKGIALGLNNLMKTDDGEPLGSVQSKAEDDFADFA
jgi:hypothetical protein